MHSSTICALSMFRTRAAGLTITRCPERRVGQPLDVVRLHEVSRFEHRVGLRRAHQRQRSARRGAQVDALVLPRRIHHRHDVLLDQWVDVDLAYGLLQLDHFLGVRDLLKRLDRVLLLLGVHHQHLVGGVRIAEPHAHQEAVELRLGQRERALVLDRVLRGEDHERRGHLARHAVDGDLSLLHRLQQRGLRLGGGAVDLVGEHDLRHHRAGPELELARRLVEDGDARDIRRQQVRRELDALEAAPGGAGERPRQHRLAYAGHVLQQQVAPAEQRHKREPRLFRLADDHPFDVVEDALGDLAWILHVGPPNPSQSGLASPRQGTRRHGQIDAASASIAAPPPALPARGARSLKAREPRIRSCGYDGRDIRRGGPWPQIRPRRLPAPRGSPAGAACWPLRWRCC